MTESSADKLFSQGLQHMRMGELDAAYPPLQEAVAMEPARPDILAAYGQILHLRGEYQHACKVLESALTLDYSNLEALRWIGFAYDQAGAPEKAVYYYLRALEIVDDPNIRVNLGTIYLTTGQHELAIAQYDQALRMNASDPDIYVAKGQVLLDMGRFEEGASNIRKAAELNPDRSFYWMMLGKGLVTLGKNAEARDAYERAVRTVGTEEERADAHQAMAEFQEESGEYPSAVEHRLVEIGIRQKCDDKHALGLAYWNLGWNYIKTGRFGDALEANRLALACEPGWVPVRFNQGLALLHMGDREAALKEYQHGLDRLQDLADLDAHGIADLRAAMADAPHLDGADEALRMLEAKRREWRARHAAR